MNIPEDSRKIWEKTRDVDNPLSPWTEKYAADMKITDPNKLSSRPSFEEVDSHYRVAKRIAIIGAVILTLFLIVVWPCITIAFKSFSLQEFKHWVSLHFVPSAWFTSRCESLWFTNVCIGSESSPCTSA